MADWPKRNPILQYYSFVRLILSWVWGGHVHPLLLRVIHLDISLELRRAPPSLPGVKWNFAATSFFGSCRPESCLSADRAADVSAWLKYHRRISSQGALWSQEHTQSSLSYHRTHSIKFMYSSHFCILFIIIIILLCGKMSCAKLGTSNIYWLSLGLATSPKTTMC